MNDENTPPVPRTLRPVTLFSNDPGVVDEMIDKDMRPRKPIDEYVKDVRRRQASATTSRDDEGDHERSGDEQVPPVDGGEAATANETEDKPPASKMPWNN